MWDKLSSQPTSLVNFPLLHSPHLVQCFHWGPIKIPCNQIIIADLDQLHRTHHTPPQRKKQKTTKQTKQQFYHPAMYS